MDDDGIWAPRAAQEERLHSLDSEFASGRATIDRQIERAALLSALDRRIDAQQAFVEILLRAPTYFSALNEFGNCLTSMGMIAAACRVYSEAVAHHPANPMGHVNLANLLLRGGDLAGARMHYESALRLDPGHPQAHRGLGAVLSGLGDRRSAQSHFQKGFAGCSVTSLPYRGSRPPVRVLLLVSSGSGNIPTASFLDDRIFMASVVVADFLDPSIALPAHRVVFNAIGDADLCSPALAAATRLVNRTGAPVINHPSTIYKTGRISIAERFRELPGVVTPKVLAMPRAVLSGPEGAAAISGHGFVFPLLLRSPGFHTGHHFVLVESVADLAAAAGSLPSDDLLAIEYLDARGHDGNARKYRVMIVDGRIYPMHLAISRQWKVHYFTADMANRPDYRAEEGAFLGNMRIVLGQKAFGAIERITRELGLDYGGIDFGLNAAGDVLLFEANATMVVNPPDADERWAYRRASVGKILEAVSAMILRRAAETPESNVA